MTEQQRAQLKEIENENSFLSFGVITHTANLRHLPKNYHDKCLHLRDCYVSPSMYKRRAENDILCLIDEINKYTDLYAHDYTILSYNTMMFTCSFVVTDYKTGELIALYYFTRTKSICFEF